MNIKATITESKNGGYVVSVTLDDEVMAQRVIDGGVVVGEFKTKDEVDSWLESIKKTIKDNLKLVKQPDKSILGERTIPLS